jgi:alpha/beta superfamily hydrolase
MRNNVVDALAEALLERRVICLRFNFRGTGRSQGAYSDGIGELDDVRAAMDFLDRLDGVDRDRIVVAGYSFGCWVGLKAAAMDSRPSRLIGISPPVNEYDFSFLKNEKRPKLLIAGDRDFVCSVSGFQQVLAEIPEPKVGITLTGADHFHFGREKHIMRETQAFLDAYPWDTEIVSRVEARPES